tara:strand:+ start:61 stop:552 length:492 start_codon:yes stop_codon:yes gene_type:complete
MTESDVRAKGPDAFRTIGEAAAEVGVAAHVLRFWEGKFPALCPLKRGGNRRYYRPRDIELLHRIKRLLHEQGYTVKGAQKVLRAQGGVRSAEGADARETPLQQSARTSKTGATEPLSPLDRQATAGSSAAVVSQLKSIAETLDAMAAECAVVAAGKAPPTGKD